MMHNDDWVAFMKESKSRFASYNAEKKTRKPSVVKERPSQLVRSRSDRYRDSGGR
jgi:hypothetical protein